MGNLGQGAGGKSVWGNKQELIWCTKVFEFYVHNEVYI